MKPGDTIYIEILNKRSVLKTLNALNFKHHIDQKAMRELVKAPITRMKDTSKTNLVKQKSVKTGSLLNSFAVRSEALIKSFYSFFGSTSKYNYPIDIGTGDRYTKKGRWTGAVGKATTNYKGRNYSFKLGFANRAVNDVLPSIEGDLAKGIDAIIQSIIIRNKI